jgi:hypothetical protein
MPSMRQYAQAMSILPTDAFLIDRIGVGTMYIEAEDFLTSAGAYDVAMNYLGVPPASQIFLGFAVVREFSLPASFTLSQAVFTTPPTNQVQLTIQRNGTPIGTITWAATAQVGVFAGAGYSMFTAGDLIEIVSGGNLYAAADLILTLAGTIP